MNDVTLGQRRIMIENKQLGICGPSWRQGFKALVRVLLGGAVFMSVMSVSACQTLGSEEGALPDAIRSAGSVLRAEGYPNLSKVPPVPKDLPSEKNWVDLEAGLQSEARRLETKAGAQPVTQLESDQDWASQAKLNLEKSPKSLPLEASTTDAAVWAAKTRASIEAGIARLPPS